MVQVKTLREHGNALGDKYQKTEGDQYDHPDPRQLIRDKIVEKVTADAAEETEPTKPSGRRQS